MYVAPGQVHASTLEHPWAHSSVMVRYLAIVRSPDLDGYTYNVSHQLYQLPGHSVMAYPSISVISWTQSGNCPQPR